MIQAQEVKSSLSISNVIRIDFIKNRQTVNQFIRNILDLEWELGNVTLSMSMQLQQLRDFVTVPASINSNQQISASLAIITIVPRAC